MTADKRKIADILANVETATQALSALVSAGNLKVTPSIPITLAQLIKVQDSFTRPAPTTQYTAGDEVSNNATQASAVALHFANLVATNGNSGYIVKAELFLDIAAVAITNGVFRLYLFKVAPTMVGDNNPFPLLTADTANIVGFIDFAIITGPAGSSTAYGLDDGIRLPFICGAASKDLYGILVANAAFTPIASTVVTVKLTAELA